MVRLRFGVRLSSGALARPDHTKAAEDCRTPRPFGLSVDSPKESPSQNVSAFFIRWAFSHENEKIVSSRLPINNCGRNAGVYVTQRRRYPTKAFAHRSLGEGGSLPLFYVHSYAAARTRTGRGPKGGGDKLSPPLGLEFETAGGRQLLQCWNTEGIFSWK
jgi:hypothetical protein